MKTKPYLTASLFITLGLLILESFNYLTDPSDTYRIPLMFLFLFGIMAGIFETRESYDRNIFLLANTILLAVMWIFSYTRVPITDTTFYLEIVVFTIIIIILVIYAIRTDKKNQKALEYYDDILFGNPDDIITLNNKGVELAHQGKYWKAMGYFDRVLEIDPEDSAALNNKGIIMEKINHYMSNEHLDKAKDLDPGLEKAMASGKLVLDVKKKKGKYLPKNSI